MASVTRALADCPRITRRRLGILSASAPANHRHEHHGQRERHGDESDGEGELSVSRRTSQTRATICMFMAVNEVMELAHSHRKSGMPSDSKVSAPMPRSRLEGFPDAAAASGAAVLAERG